MMKTTILSVLNLAQYARAFELEDFMKGVSIDADVMHLYTWCLEPTVNSASEQTLVLAAPLQSFLSTMP